MIETERLLLRVPCAEDADAALEHLLDPEVMRFIGGYDPDVDAAAVVDRWLARWQANDVGPFAVVRREDGRFLGRTGFLVWDTRDWRPSTYVEAGEHAQLELGWVLAREHWGKGYATEAARAARDWLRAERDAGSLISLIRIGNVASERVAERLGASAVQTVMAEPDVPYGVWLHPG